MVDNPAEKVDECPLKWAQCCLCTVGTLKSVTVILKANTAVILEFDICVYYVMSVAVF